ncbi:BREX-2 system adenine-specific DNA-methyltransferase PglX [Micromonospora robiginosa]|uniref:site-specific DNA-methyltransferase (adenine-specific) n=1 Tax=Micromonospora robiginosa TaxID=2749844 RepID=A0A7L6BDA8_9ACTN|nr:BREX-2 system adenine-specific DNA-methyltransferase PglX [Micromonospora ferruginea]QLQ39640.1 BREX-2 system adenine-specific DNA-methyltransferase PglX [Micromonospora ferruginea]
MGVSTGLTAALKKVVLDLEDDLRDRVASQPDVLATWKQEHEAAKSRERTAMSWQEWRDDRVTQAAVAWVLTTVFVRFCEDNRLLKPVWIAGPADRRQEALDAELAYFRAHPEDTDREWVLQSVEHLRITKATQDLVESHSPLWTVSPSGQAAKRLIAFWRERTADGNLVWDFADTGLSTRFLGDLYQDLSDYAKKTFALLQTPEFVEEFILDQTMEPALAERPLEGFRLIDPTCGSGHFLLGAFARLNDRWATHAPGLEVQTRVQNALDAIHGVDLNPFAVAVARFRLVVASLRASGLTSLESAPAFRFHLASGDSLLHGRSQMEFEAPDMIDTDSSLSGFTYKTEDLAILRSILEPRQYDVVVGNPPYITVRDPRLKAAIKGRYPTCTGLWVLSIPFMERFFQLARLNRNGHPAGWVGQITSNSFMQRGFGRYLVENFLPTQDLKMVLNSEGAWIPGHNSDGTPTVIMIGKPGPPSSSTVRLVLSKGRRESRSVGDDGEGPYWTALSRYCGDVGYEDPFIKVIDIPRSSLTRHPWVLAGDGSEDLLRLMDRFQNLKELTYRIGFYGDSHADEAFFLPKHTAGRWRVPSELIEDAARGDGVRDWNVSYLESALLPKTLPGRPNIEAGLAQASRHYWPLRTELWARAFGSGDYRSEGRDWLAWHQLPLDRNAHPWKIAFAEVAAQNNFCLDRLERVFNRTAPIVKLAASATEEDFVSLVALLNSSAASFWLKRKCKPKGGAADITWLRTYQMTSTMLAQFPVPKILPTARAQKLDALATRLNEVTPEVAFLSRGETPTQERINELREAYVRTLGELISNQEELDWDVYRSFGLTTGAALSCHGEPPAINLGDRAFEVALARQGDNLSGPDKAWFTRQGIPAQRDVPARLPVHYQELVNDRLSEIDRNPLVRLLERPEFKRQWAIPSWDERVASALHAWLLGKLEGREYWFDAAGRPVARSVTQIADLVSRDGNAVSVIDLWSRRRGGSLIRQLEELLMGESAPFLAAYRLKDSGLRKREAWEHTWELQRREDKGEKVGEIPVPPKYATADFRKQSWWQHRGKLDVPKERFILYPDAGRETDPTQLLGWAGWDHAQQALALNAVIAEREAEGWSDDRLVPLVAGLAELQPWVRQWHDKTDPTYQLNLADYLEEQLRGRAHQVGMTVEQLGAWRPPAASRGRRPRS